MNSSQMLITMGAMFLLGIVILRVNNSFFTTSDVLLSSKFNIVAISLASSMIEEANSKAFDENTISASVSTYASITNFDALGPDSGEVRMTFDDFDDFNGFSIRDTFVVDSLLLGYFDINCSVDYVNEVNPDLALTTKSWNKNFKVTVTSPSMTDTVTMSTIYSYWYFR
jgi:hypothetical protein